MARVILQPNAPCSKEQSDCILVATGSRPASGTTKEQASNMIKSAYASDKSCFGRWQAFKKAREANTSLTPEAWLQSQGTATTNAATQPQPQQAQQMQTPGVTAEYVEVKVTPEPEKEPEFVQPKALVTPEHKAGVISEELQPHKDYVPTDAADEIKSYQPREPYLSLYMACVKMNIPVVLVGDASVGKTTMPMYVAWLLGRPWQCFPADNLFNSRELFGSLSIRNGTSQFTPGRFTILSQVESMLHIPEGNGMDPGKNFVLHEVVNSRRFFVKEAENGAGKEYHLHPNCHLTLDCNPPDPKYPGVLRFNVAFLDRFAVIQMPMWDGDELRTMFGGKKKGGKKKRHPILEYKPNKDDADPEKLVTFFEASQQLIHQAGGAMRYCLTLRAMKRVTKFLNFGLNIRAALELGVFNAVELSAGAAARTTLEGAAKGIWNGL